MYTQYTKLNTNFPGKNGYTNKRVVMCKLSLHDGGNSQSVVPPPISPLRKVAIFPLETSGATECIGNKTTKGIIVIIIITGLTKSNT